MPSTAYNNWSTDRAQELDEIEQAHSAVGGTGRGRRYTTQQINRAYAVLLASHFQGFSRDLHSESVAYLVGAIGLSTLLSPLMQTEFLRGRQLDRGNAQPGSIGADFGRFGINFWDEVNGHSHQRGQEAPAR